MTAMRETSSTPWPGDPTTAWAAVAEDARTQRLSDRPAQTPRMDDLGTRLWRINGRVTRLVGLALLLGTVVVATALLRSLSGDGDDWIVIAMAILAVVVMVGLGLFFLLYPRRSWGPTAWVAEHARLCEAHPYRLRLRKQPSNSAVATILLGGAGLEGPTVRMDEEQAVRIVKACEQWATQLEGDPTAYAEFWRQWKRRDPQVLPTELIFGPEAAGGFITCVDRRHRWFLVVPHRRKAQPDNPWHYAHTLPVWWTDEHANSVGIDWGSLRGES